MCAPKKKLKFMNSEICPPPGLSSHASTSGGRSQSEGQISEFLNVKPPVQDFRNLPCVRVLSSCERLWGEELKWRADF